MSNITIRPARGSDSDDLARLAKLDSKAAPSGRVFVAEVCGAPVAALELATGRVVADPFKPTAHVVDLLRVHAAVARGRRARTLRNVTTFPELA